jgi:hypothetical protein
MMLAAAAAAAIATLILAYLLVIIVINSFVSLARSSGRERLVSRRRQCTAWAAHGDRAGRAPARP